MIYTAPITFLSDFGLKDAYVGSVKGMILSLHPAARILDITHEIPAFDVKAAAYHLATYYQFFPNGTIHLAVVDPGVGGNRLPLILKTAKYFFVGPDNGLFSYVIQNEGIQAYIINVSKLQKLKGYEITPSSTFHARDIFGPAAAILSRNRNVQLIADEYSGDLNLLLPKQSLDQSNLMVRIIRIDRFGNLITEFHKSHLSALQKQKLARIMYKNKNFTALSDRYEAVAKGKPLVLWGSSGFLEIAVNQGSAAEYFQTDYEKDRIELDFK